MTWIPKNRSNESATGNDKKEDDDDDDDSSQQQETGKSGVFTNPRFS